MIAIDSQNKGKQCVFQNSKRFAFQLAPKCCDKVIALISRNNIILIIIMYLKYIYTGDSIINDGLFEVFE